jgi:putative intracellular protease/amidase
MFEKKRLKIRRMLAARPPPARSRTEVEEVRSPYRESSRRAMGGELTRLDDARRACERPGVRRPAIAIFAGGGGAMTLVRRRQPSLRLVRHRLARATFATALAATAAGALAVGALAIGALAIGALAVKKARVGRLEIDELHVRAWTGAPAPAP